jgi:hypothetical protein
MNDSLKGDKQQVGEVNMLYGGRIGGAGSHCTSYHGQPIACHAQDTCFYTRGQYTKNGSKARGQCKKFSFKDLDASRARSRNRYDLAVQFDIDAGKRWKRPGSPSLFGLLEPAKRYKAQNKQPILQRQETERKLKAREAAELLALQQAQKIERQQKQKQETERQSKAREAREAEEQLALLQVQQQERQHRQQQEAERKQKQERQRKQQQEVERKLREREAAELLALQQAQQIERQRVQAQQKETERQAAVRYAREAAERLALQQAQQIERQHQQDSVGQACNDTGALSKGYCCNKKTRTSQRGPQMQSYRWCELDATRNAAKDAARNAAKAAPKNKN